MCVCVRVCVCVCLHPSTVKASSVWIRWDTREQINNVMLKTLNSYADSLHRYFRMQNLNFQLAALRCWHTRSRQSHDLTSVGVAFGTSVHTTSWADLVSNLTLKIGFPIYLGKAKVTRNFSIESNPRQST